MTYQEQEAFKCLLEIALDYHAEIGRRQYGHGFKDCCALGVKITQAQEIMEEQ